MSGVDENEHRDHLDNSAYQAAIERAAIQETGESTASIKSRTVANGEKEVVEKPDAKD
jgi:hypothetical protein